MSEPSQAVNDRAMARAQEEVTRRTALGEFGQPPNLALRDRAMKEIFEQELSRLSHMIRCGSHALNPYLFRHDCHFSVLLILLVICLSATTHLRNVVPLSLLPRRNSTSIKASCMSGGGSFTRTYHHRGFNDEAYRGRAFNYVEQLHSD